MRRPTTGTAALLIVAASTVLLLVAAPAALAAVYTQDECLTCHSAVTPGIVSQYQEGAMSQAPNNVTCIDCHGADHAVIFQEQGQVKASTCAGCHPQQYGEFAKKDGSGALVEKHALSWTKMTAGARYQVMPQSERYAMCERCHNIGYVWSDGSIGKCDSCHTRHVFSAAEAREPQACGTCHMGPDHEQIDMYEKSKHGVVYETEKDRPGGDPSRAPTCVTCHMPTQENGVGQALTHNVSTNITYGTVSQGAEAVGVAQPVPMRSVAPADFTARRAKMLSVCEQCHAPAFATQQLDDADQVKFDVDAKLWDAVKRIRGLWYDGLLDPMPQDRAPNPIYGNALVIGGQQLYGGTSAIEQLFFQTYKYDHVSTFKGAYHISPDYSHWYGWARVNADLDLIKGEEARLRKAAFPYDAGFSASARPTVGVPVSFDGHVLAGWGDASPNTFDWQFGDAYQDASNLGAAPTHTYAAAGRFPVQLTVADSDLVNEVTTPTACSAKRTTTLTVTVKQPATIALSDPARVKAGTVATVRGSVKTGDGGLVTLQLHVRRGSGSWHTTTAKVVTATAGKATAFSFRVAVRTTTRLRVTFAGDADTWNAVSPVAIARVR